MVVVVIGGGGGAVVWLHEPPVGVASGTGTHFYFVRQVALYHEKGECLT